jgi:MscS family membrane protein
MMSASLSPARVAIVCLLLLGIFGPQVQSQEKQGDKLRSPRATVRTLLTTITAARANPQLIQAAASCLDLSGLPANQQNTGGLLATQLEAVLRAADVDTELIPDDLQETTYVLPGGHRIGLQRMPDKRWLFDRETVAQIPKLYTEAQKLLQDKNREAASLSVSSAHATARATVRTLVDAYRRQDFDRILKCLDLSEIPSVARQEVGTQLANKLKQIIVRQPRIILQEIPDSNYSDPFVWISQPEGVIEVARLAAGPRKGEWVFSRDTVRSLDKLYVVFEDKPYREELVALGTSAHLPTFWGETELWVRSRLPAWLRATIWSDGTLSLQVFELLGYLLLPLLTYGLYRLTMWVVAGCLHRLLQWRSWVMPHHTLRKQLRPTSWFICALFLRWGLLVLGPDRVLLIPFLTVLNPLTWIFGLLAVFGLIDLVGKSMEAHWAEDRGRPEITQMLWPVGSLVIKIVLFTVLMFQLMTMFSWDVTAVLTGLGIGGLAFALGAQDSLKNLFGSFTLIADRPFVVGESVKIGNHEVGVVETVGLRSTHIRTTNDTVLIVPNSNLTTLEITNYGRRRYRYYTTRIGLAYSTPPELLIEFRDGIQKVIRRQECTRKDKIEVAINELAASAIEILVVVYFEVADQHQELVARDALILDILRLATELGIELAYPTQTIHVVPPAAPAGQTLQRPELAVSGHPPH